MLARRTPADDTADRHLIARIVARDRPAFEEFYHAHARGVLLFARDIVRTHEVAEEVVSDAMIAVWNSADCFTGQSRVITWLLGITHHKAHDALRRLERFPIPLDHIALGNLVRPVTDVFAQIDNQLALDDALEALSPEHRTVLSLTFGYACSQAEIAQITDCSVATVKTRVFYAKRRLRDELERTSAEEPA